MSDTPRTDKAAYEYPKDYRTEEAWTVGSGLLILRVRWCNLLNESRELERELARAKKAREWQPIETATKEINVILYQDGEPPFEGFWDIDGWCDFDGRPVMPTHWMPLPEPPEQTEQDDE